MVAEAAVKTNPIQKEVCHVIELALKGDESVRSILLQLRTPPPLKIPAITRMSTLASTITRLEYTV